MLFRQAFSFLSPMDLHHFHQTCIFIHVFLFYKYLIYQLQCKMEREKSWKNLGFFFIASIHLNSLINTHMSNIYCNNIVKCLSSKQKMYLTFQTLSILSLLSCIFFSNSTTIASHKICNSQKTIKNTKTRDWFLCHLEIYSHKTTQHHKSFCH